MVQIREYTQREGRQPLSRGGLNISKPKVLQQGIGTTLSAEPLETASELAELGLKMKERRDDAVVDAFINQHSVAATKQLNDSQNRHKGLNAYKVMDEYNKWNEDYITKYSSYDSAAEHDDEHVYLENEAQIKKAKDRMAKSHVSTINSISNYIGREEEGARRAAANALIQDQAEKIAKEKIPENINIYKDNIKKAYARMLKDAPMPVSDELADGEKISKGGTAVDRKVKETMDAAVTNNLMRTATEDPLAALELIDMPIYKDNMSEKNRKKAKETIQKMYQSTAANNIAEQLAQEDIIRGKETSPEVQDVIIDKALDGVLKSDVFDNVDKREYKAKIKKDAAGKRAQIFKEQVEDQAKAQNDVLLDNYMNGRWSMKDISQDDLDIIMNTYNGNNTIETLNAVAMQKAADEVLLRHGIEIPATTDEQQDRYRNVLANIRSGEYKVVGDMHEDLGRLPADYQAYLLSKFMNNYNFNKKVNSLDKKTKTNMQATIDGAYKTYSGLDPKKSVGTYENFRNALADSINDSLMNGEKFTTDMVKDAAYKAWSSLWAGDNEETVATRLIYDYDKAVVANSTTKTIINEDFRKEQAKNVIKSTSFNYDLTDANREEIAQYIVKGDSDMISAVLNRVMDAEYQRAVAKKREREETKRSVNDFYKQLITGEI